MTMSKAKLIMKQQENTWIYIQEPSISENHLAKCSVALQQGNTTQDTRTDMHALLSVLTARTDRICQMRVAISIN